ncbi:MAG TPA: DUF3857 domain-containing protein [Thermoanaerobaculia bacterium]|nr:DUF3857 domain-containing protein [Thermoanaerobaculia bacterium]
MPLLLSSLALLAAPPPSPEPWAGAPFTADPAAVARAAARVEGQEGDDVVVLLAEASYSYDEAGRETYTQRLVYRILTPGAHESWSTVQESWAPWHQARPEIRARVITPDGAEHGLDPATVAENGTAQASPEMFEDDRVLRARCPPRGRPAIRSPACPPRSPARPTSPSPPASRGPISPAATRRSSIRRSAARMVPPGSSRPWSSSAPRSASCAPTTPWRTPSPCARS